MRGRIFLPGAFFIAVVFSCPTCYSLTRKRAVRYNMLRDIHSVEGARHV